MDTENLIVDDDAQGKEIEHIGEVMPDICVSVLPGAFCVKAVRLRDSTRFMVATDEVHAMWVS